MSKEVDRRAVLRGTAMIAAPIAAVAVPAAAVAADDTARRLAESEDRHAIGALHGKLMRRMADNGPVGARDLIPSDAVKRLGQDLGAVVALGDEDPIAELSPDGRSASLDCRCRVERLVHHKGNSTLEKMARLQGTASTRTTETHLLRTHFARGAEGWTVIALELA